MIPSQVARAGEEHVLGLVTGASGVSQALVLDPRPSLTLLVEHLQIYSHIFQLTSLVITTMIASTKATSFSSINCFPFLLFHLTLSSLRHLKRAEII